MKISPIIRLLLQNPHLLIEHIRNYGLLIGTEAQDVLRHIVRNMICLVVMMISVLSFLILSGVSLIVGLVMGNFTRYCWPPWSQQRVRWW